MKVAISEIEKVNNNELVTTLSLDLSEKIKGLIYNETNNIKKSVEYFSKADWNKVYKAVQKSIND